MTPDNSWHALSLKDVCSILSVDASRGLTDAEVQLRLAEHGPNLLPEARQRPLWRVIASQFASPLIYILFVAAVISAAMGHWTDAGVILLVVFINAGIGTFQEGRAERSVASLRRLSSLKSRVFRDGHERIIEARDLVPGDVLVLAAGDALGADARLIHGAALEISEAALTGESLPVAKQTEPLGEDTPLADRTNMVYSATHVTAGRARAVVTSTGQATEVGKIASLTLQAKDPKTPLEQRLAQFGKWLTAGAVVLFLAILITGYLRGLPFGDIFMVAVSQMVSVVPEGLQVAMTIGLAVGMQRMVRRRALVRRLAAVETLGSTTIICTDKTGTLTRNEMTVTVAVLPDGRRVQITGSGYNPEGGLLAGDQPVAEDDSAVRSLTEAVALCNDASLVPPDARDSRWRALGDPTEAALLVFAVKHGVDIHALQRRWQRHAEIPFDSDSKLMVTQHRCGNAIRTVIKGAPEKVLALCGDSAGQQRFLSATEALAQEALRVLAVAEATHESVDLQQGYDALGGRIQLLGLVGQMDPPREEVKAAVEKCLAAGIRPVMVTGDHQITGLAIARMLGIAREGDMAVDGAKLDMMPEQDLRASLDRISVFARVHPAQKLRIVEALQAQGQVVAMTGDGVNDAPALATADVGVAMGMTGTEVAKSAAKMVITDDNFASIVHAVEEGRLVRRNLGKVVLFLFATSLDEVLVLMLALLLGYPLPLAAVQILWINIVTEGTVTVNLIMEGLEGDEMKCRPPKRNEALIGRESLNRLLVMVGTSVAVVFGFFHWRLSTGVSHPLVQTETFTLMAVCQWFNVLNCRSATKSALTFDVFRNWWLVGGLLLGNLLHFLVVYTEPMNRLFRTVPIPLADFFLIGALGSLVLWAEEIRKRLLSMRLPHSASA
ncbi:Ca2+-transporting ATPase [Roseimicrobium gellanilyticum]|uniref:Ca2+-transporting ATPase n=1 Tax=Roseimicrobium gellanilyticum TaxID=748857 RepID=A0A366H8T5_9BACT|nr:HAD-IC family P-type ATPase [Roseimicrobium gellanilyticum]RBP38179.1 Ca2+-transporting ATPase [Roseimicrobium gellanilyticum]